jgi:oxidase EvaA
MKERDILFLKSAMVEENSFNSTLKVIEWVKQRNESIKVSVDKVAFSELDGWSLDSSAGVLKHETGRFFSIDGIKISTNWGNVSSWEQPIIDQPEIGFLGIITKEIEGVLHFLLQSKIEPGNVNNVQLSPTLQATKSNYSQVHNGNKPNYLDFFLNAKKEQILLDQLQSEQGARFLKKRNRNIIIKVDEDVPVLDDFVWLTLGQIKKLMRYDNLVNMDTRTVISGIPYGNFGSDVSDLLSVLTNENRSQGVGHKLLLSALDSFSSIYSFDGILNWITSLKIKYELAIDKTSIFELKDWEVTDREIIHRDNNYFKVIAANVEISNREVSSWMQPLVEPIHEGIIGFIVKEINGVFHFLVQGKVECGNFDLIEMAPTVQCITGSYRDSLEEVPYLKYFVNAKESSILYDTLQSEEGGRFFREQNRNMIIMVGEEFSNVVPENYTWMTLNQLNMFLKFNNYLNIQARGLISAISFI